VKCNDYPYGNDCEWNARSPPSPEWCRAFSVAVNEDIFRILSSREKQKIKRWEKKYEPTFMPKNEQTKEAGKNTIVM
jgi:hypothetical protein